MYYEIGSSQKCSFHRFVSLSGVSLSGVDCTLNCYQVNHGGSMMELRHVPG